MYEIESDRTHAACHPYSGARPPCALPFQIRLMHVVAYRKHAVRRVPKPQTLTLMGRTPQTLSLADVAAPRRPSGTTREKTLVSRGLRREGSHGASARRRAVPRP